MPTNVTSHWLSQAYPQHSSIKSVSSRVEQLAEKEPPDLGALEPGDSVTWSKQKPSREVVTGEDRIEFRNGGSIEDKPGEKGLLVKTPDGRSFELDGSIFVDTFDGQPMVMFKTANAQGSQEWEQTFPSEGGSVLEEDPTGHFPTILSVSPEGEVSGHMDDPEYGPEFPGQRHGNVLVYERQEGDMAALNPAVPLDWLTAQ